MTSQSNPIKWVDGLRGIAAFIVAVDHFFLGAIEPPFRSFWTEPAKDNRYWYQLPPFSIAFAAKALVVLFMVLSGFSVSVSILQARDQGDTLRFYQKVTSSAFRRVFRLYIPVFIMSTLGQLALYLGLYHWWWPELDEMGIVTWSRINLHIKYYLAYLIDSLNLLQMRKNYGLNDQLWTIPRELRGSFCVYFTTLILAPLKHNIRLFGIFCISTHALWQGDWDIFAFLAGLMIAESTHYTSNISNFTNASIPIKERHERACQGRNYVSKPSLTVQVAYIWLLTMSIYVLCQPYHPGPQPGYALLESLTPYPYRDIDWVHTKFAHSALASVGLVVAIDNLPMLQDLLSTKPCQFLGHISFGLYLTHLMVYRIIRNPIMNFVYWTMTGYRYHDTGDKWGPTPFKITWWVSGFIVIPIALAISKVAAEHIDRRAALWARTIEQWMTEKPKRKTSNDERQTQ